MSLALALIRNAQRVLGDGLLARWLAASGVPQLVRWPHDRRVLKRGQYEAELLDRPTRFAVTSRTQLAHIHGLWREEDLLRRMLAALREGDVVFDVGANIGLFTLALALNARERRPTLHAFEPEPRNAEALRANLALNHVLHARVHEFALGERTGEARFYLDSREGAGNHSLIRRADLEREVSVKLARADDLEGELGEPDLVKIDVEGAEFAVLRGMQGMLERHAVRELFLELHPADLAASGEDEGALRRWLGERGYVAAWSQRRGQEWHEHYRPREAQPSGALAGR